MSEILYNPYYLTPIASLFGCLIAFGFCFYYYEPKMKFLRDRLRDKADDLYRAKHQLEKSRYELVITASESTETFDESTNLLKIIDLQKGEIIELKQQIARLEDSQIDRFGTGGIRSHLRFQNKFEDFNSGKKQFSDLDTSEPLKKSA
jgi:hypothetical protein